MKKISLVLLLFTAYCLPHTAYCYAANYYVSPTGSNTNPGTEAQPWATIQKAADTMAPGDIARVLAGNYGGDVSVFRKVKITKSGTLNQPIIFQAVGSVLTQGFIVSADYIHLKGFDVEDPHDDRVKNATEPDYRGGTGIFVEGSHNLIEANYVHGCVWDGIILSKSGNFALPSDTVVKNNRLFRNGMAGIEVTGRNNRIEGNEVWATIQHHPGNILSASVTWLDADGMRFFGSGHTLNNNHIHDIPYGAPGVNLNPNDPQNIYDLTNDYNDNPHIDCFQTWADSYHEMASNITFNQNLCENLQSQAERENGSGFMLAGGANNITITNNVVKTYSGVNTGGTGGAHHLYIYHNFWLNNLTFHNFWPNALTIGNTPYVIVKNNIFYNQPYHTINADGTITGSEFDYNLAYNDDGSKPDCVRVGSWVCSPPTPHDLWQVNPLITNDYHLSTNSPACTGGEAGTYMGAFPCSQDYRNFQNFLKSFTNIFDFNRLIGQIFQ